MKQLTHRLQSTLILLLILLAGPAALAESSVFKVSKGKNITYIAGTFHLLNSTDHPLPSGYETAYNASSKVYFETDMRAAQSPAFQMKFMQALSAPAGSTLQSSLKPETYKALEEYLTKKGLLIGNFMPFSPAGASLILSLNEYQRLGMEPQYGVDSVYSQKATADGKTIGQLETIEEQLTFIANLGKGQGDEMVMYTLEELDNIDSEVKHLKQLWRAGKLDTMDKKYLHELREQFPSTYSEIISDRNNNWMPHIEKMLKDSATEVVMVGGLHLAGPDGLIHQLKQKGYKVEQL